MTKSTSRILIFCVGVVVLFLLMYRRDISDIFTGYWKFRALCELEGGARFYAPVQKDVGWMLADVHKYKDHPNSFPYYYNPAFFRYRNIYGEEYDVTRVFSPAPANSPGSSNYRYVINPADKLKPVRYLYKHAGIPLTSKEGVPSKGWNFLKEYVEINDLETGKVVASYTSPIYRWTTARWFLDNPFSSGERCPDIPVSYKSKFPQEIYEDHVYHYRRYYW